MLLKKRFALLGAILLGALLGAITSSIPITGPIEVGATSDHGPIYTPRTFAAEKPAPVKPAAEPVAPHQVAMKARFLEG